MTGSCMYFMELYTKYKPYLAIQVSQKQQTSPLFVGSPNETDKSLMAQEELHSSLQLDLKQRRKPWSKLYNSIRNNMLTVSVRQGSSSSIFLKCYIKKLTIHLYHKVKSQSNIIIQLEGGFYSKSSLLTRWPKHSSLAISNQSHN